MLENSIQTRIADNLCRVSLSSVGENNAKWELFELEFKFIIEFSDYLNLSIEVVSLNLIRVQCISLA